MTSPELTPISSNPAPSDFAGELLLKAGVIDLEGLNRIATCGHERISRPVGTK